MNWLSRNAVESNAQSKISEIRKHATSDASAPILSEPNSWHTAFHGSAYEAAARIQTELNHISLAIQDSWFFASVGVADCGDRDTFYLSTIPNVGGKFGLLNVVSWTSWLGDLYTQARAGAQQGTFPDKLEYGSRNRKGTHPVGPVVDYFFRQGLLTGFDYYFLDDVTPKIAKSIDPAAEPAYGLREIIRSIDLDQNAQIRGPMNGVFILLGGPGTGKTTVALHRIPYLIFEHRSESQTQATEQSGVDFNRSDLFTEESLLVVVWKEHLVPYLRRCVRELHLSKMAENGVRHFDEWINSQIRRYVPTGPQGYKMFGDEPDEIHEAKLALSEVDLRDFIDEVSPRVPPLGREFHAVVNFIESELNPFKLKDIFKASIQNRLSKVAEEFSLDTANAAVATIRNALSQLNLRGEDKQGIDKRLQERLDAFHNYAIKAFANCVDRLYDFYESPAVMGALAEKLDESRKSRFLEYVQQQRSNRTLSRTDRLFVLWLIHFLTKSSVENAKQLKPLPTFSHVMIDEAQYYEPIALRLLAELTSLPDGVMTIVGDLEQRITSKGGVLNWEDFGIQIPRDNVRRLETNYRSSRMVFEFLEKFKSVGKIAEPLKKPFMWLSGDGYEPRVLTADDREMEFELIAHENAEIKTNPNFEAWSVAIVLPSDLEATAKEMLIPKLNEFAIPARWATGEDVKESLEKVIITDYDSIVGLEFDAMFVAAVDDVLKDHTASRGSNAVWVALSRARQFLRVSRVGGDNIFDSPIFAAHKNS